MSILRLSTLRDIIQTKKGEKMSEADCFKRSDEVVASKGLLCTWVDFIIGNFGHAPM